MPRLKKHLKESVSEQNPLSHPDKYLKSFSCLWKFIHRQAAYHINANSNLWYLFWQHWWNHLWVAYAVLQQILHNCAGTPLLQSWVCKTDYCDVRYRTAAYVKYCLIVQGKYKSHILVSTLHLCSVSLIICPWDLVVKFWCRRQIAFWIIFKLLCLSVKTHQPHPREVVLFATSFYVRKLI